MRAGVEMQQDSLLANWNDIPTSHERDPYRQRHQQEQCPFVYLKERHALFHMSLKWQNKIF